jgi:hypothetical protein
MMKNFRTGEMLGIILAGFFVIWLGADAIIWFAGGATFSAWLIREQRKRLSVALAVFALLSALYMVLVWHFETIDIILMHLIEHRH